MLASVFSKIENTRPPVFAQGLYIGNIVISLVKAERRYEANILKTSDQLHSDENLALRWWLLPKTTSLRGKILTTAVSVSTSSHLGLPSQVRAQNLFGTWVFLQKLYVLKCDTGKLLGFNLISTHFFATAKNDCHLSFRRFTFCLQENTKKKVTKHNRNPKHWKKKKACLSRQQTSLGDVFSTRQLIFLWNTK